MSRTNTAIRTYIHHPNRPKDVPDKQVVPFASTDDMLEYLKNLRPPEWTLLGGIRNTGKTRLLQELALSDGAVGGHETVLVTLPDENNKASGRRNEASEQATTLFKLLYMALHHKATFSVSTTYRGKANDRNPDSVLRHRSFDDIFNLVRGKLIKLAVRRIILDNALYIRQDAFALRRLMDLRKTVRYPFVLILGVRTEEKELPEGVLQLALERAPDAADTLTKPTVVLHPLQKTDFIEVVLEELFFDLLALPDQSFIDHHNQIANDLWKVTGRGNWIRIEVLAARTDAALQLSDQCPRTLDRPGILTREVIEQVMDKMDPERKLRSLPDDPLQ